MAPEPRLAQGHDLGVGARVVQGDIAVPALAQQPAPVDHHCPDRYFTFSLGPPGQTQGVFHPAVIFRAETG